VIKIVGVVGGVLGGWAVSRMLVGTVPDTAPALIATTVGAFIGGRVLSEIAIIIIGGRGAAAGAAANRARD
jgi:hypothetical protein